MEKVYLYVGMPLWLTPMQKSTESCVHLTMFLRQRDDGGESPKRLGFLTSCVSKGGHNTTTPTPATLYARCIQKKEQKEKSRIPVATVVASYDGAHRNMSIATINDETALATSCVNIVYVLNHSLPKCVLRSVQTTQDTQNNIVKMAMKPWWDWWDVPDAKMRIGTHVYCLFGAELLDGNVVSSKYTGVSHTGERCVNKIGVTMNRGVPASMLAAWKGTPLFVFDLHNQLVPVALLWDVANHIVLFTPIQSVFDAGTSTLPTYRRWDQVHTGTELTPPPEHFGNADDVS